MNYLHIIYGLMMIITDWYVLSPLFLFVIYKPNYMITQRLDKLSCLL